MINFAPFQSFERHFHTDGFTPNRIGLRQIDIVTEHQPLGHGNSLEALSKRCKEVLENICNPYSERYSNWGKLKESMLESGDILSFHCWGTFEEVYTERLIQQYKTEHAVITFDNPSFGLKMLDELIDQNYEHFDLSLLNENEDDYEDENDSEDIVAGDDRPF